METLSLRCSNCGSNLKIPPKLQFVSCSYCGSSLAIKYEGSIFYSEVLDQIKEDTSEIKEDTAEILETVNFLKENYDHRNGDSEYVSALMNKNKALEILKNHKGQLVKSIIKLDNQWERRVNQEQLNRIREDARRPTPIKYFVAVVFALIGVCCLALGSSGNTLPLKSSTTFGVMSFSLGALILVLPFWEKDDPEFEKRREKENLEFEKRLALAKNQYIESRERVMKKAAEVEIQIRELKKDLGIIDEV